jgi:RHS repeat-associated protein
LTRSGANNFTDFVYDGLGRCVKIVETTAGSVTSTKQFVWCAARRCEERDGSGTLTKQFFSRGETIGGTPYFFTTDHLGSIREMTDSAGLVGGTTNSYIQYSYDPYGQQSVLQSHGGIAADFGYAAYYAHSRSGLNLTATRAYNAALGRFINRDPIRESGGKNLFRYAHNDPIGLTDPSGLCDADDDGPPDCEFNPDCYVPIAGGEAVEIETGFASFSGPVRRASPSRQNNDYYHLRDAFRAALKMYNGGIRPFAVGASEETAAGNTVDYFFKLFASLDPSLNHLFITPAFLFGPDVVDDPNFLWYDATTVKDFQRHIDKYASQFGRPIGFLYTITYHIVLI